MKKCIAILICLAILLPYSFAFASDNEPKTYTKGDFTFILLDNGDAEITNCSGRKKDIVIPEKLKKHLVTSIGNKAFSECTNLKEITIPDSVTSIADGSFSYCYSLEKITISPEHPILASIDGVLFSKPDKRLIWYPIPRTSSQ